jgi:hypothetical protein
VFQPGFDVAFSGLIVEMGVPAILRFNCLALMSISQAHRVVSISSKQLRYASAYGSESASNVWKRNIQLKILAG